VHACAGTYRGRMYNLLTDNCHAYVAHALSSVAYKGRGDWDMVELAALVFLAGRYVSWAAVARTWLPFALLVGLGGYFGRVWFLVAYLAAVGPLVAWFVFYTRVAWRPPPPTPAPAAQQPAPAGGRHSRHASVSSVGVPPPLRGA